jgi:hypothetical protein
MPAGLTSKSIQSEQDRVITSRIKHGTLQVRRGNKHSVKQHARRSCAIDKQVDFSTEGQKFLLIKNVQLAYLIPLTNTA